MLWPKWRPPGSPPDFLYAALDITACVALIKESRLTSPTPTISTENPRWRRLASMPGVVRMPSKYCKCPVELFGENQAGEFVGEGHWTQRQHRLSLPQV